MPLASEHVLSPDEVAFYRAEGYLIYDRPVFPQHKFEALKAHFEQKLAALPPGQRPESMDVPHFTDPALFEWLMADEVLDIVEGILGPDIALFSSHFICKPAGDGQRVPWHEDSAYWRHMLSPMEVVTVWLAVDPSTTENGCMRVIPRTHHNGYSEYEAVDAKTHVFGSEIKKALRDESKAVDCILAPNQASLHDGRLMHGSDANTSRIRRCGYTMRYVKSSTKLHEDWTGKHQLYLARGKDYGLNTWGDPTKTYPELMEGRRNRRGH